MYNYMARRKRWVKKGAKSKGWRKTGRTRKRNTKQLNVRMQKLPNSEKLFRLKIECLATLFLLAGGAPFVGNATLNFPLNYPGNWRNLNYGAVVGTYGAMPVLPSQLVRLTNLFDQYKVNSLRVKFEPYNQAVQLNTALPDPFDTPLIAYNQNDVDDIAYLGSESALLSAGTKPRNFVDGRPKTFTFYQLKDMRNFWFNSGNLFMDITAAAPAFTYSTLPPANPQASMKFMLPNLSWAAFPGPPFYYYRVYVTWDVTWRGVRST